MKHSLRKINYTILFKYFSTKFYKLKELSMIKIKNCKMYINRIHVYLLKKGEKIRPELCERFSARVRKLDVEDPGILPNGKLNWKVQWHVERRETKTGKNREKREKKERKTVRSREKKEKGEEERAGTIGTSESASLKREGAGKLRIPLRSSFPYS